MSLKEDGLGNGNQPIFIHSLWRSGSTYMFNVFRRSGQGFTCYQEALHELALHGTAEPERLLDIDVVDDYMRHPVLDKPYFQELYDALPAWANIISKDFIYENYFSGGGVDEYFASLVKASPGRPVFQEVRTGGRIDLLKNKIGGLHIYLWRNPRDQFWSFLKSSYFKSALLMILNHSKDILILENLKRIFSFNEFFSKDLFEEIEHFKNVEISYDNLYRLYFSIWCIYQVNGHRYCDLSIDIDKMSTSKRYRSSIIKELIKHGVDGICFDECKMPYFAFNDKELNELSAIEDEMLGLLGAMNYSASEMSMLKSCACSRYIDGKPEYDSTEHQLIDLRGMVRDGVNRATGQFTKAQAAINECDKAFELLGKGVFDFQNWLNTTTAAQREEIDRLVRVYDSALDAVRSAAQARENEMQSKITSLAEGMDQLQISLQDKAVAWENEYGQMSSKMVDLQVALSNAKSHIAEGRILLLQRQLFYSGWPRLWRKKRSSVNLEHRIARWLNATEFPVDFPSNSMSSVEPMMTDFDRVDSLAGNDNPYLRANSVSSLCAWHDLDFVRCAFVTILGRQPDEDGEAYYVSRLRDGAHKLSIIHDLRCSVEAKGHDPGIAGLDRLLRKHKNASRPIIGWLVRLITGREGDSNGEKRLRRVEAAVYCLQQKQAYEFSRLLDRVGNWTVISSERATSSGNPEGWNEAMIGGVLPEKARALLKRQYR